MLPHFEWLMSAGLGYAGYLVCRDRARNPSARLRRHALALYETACERQKTMPDVHEFETRVWRAIFSQLRQWPSFPLAMEVFSIARVLYAAENFTVLAPPHAAASTAEQLRYCQSITERTAKWDEPQFPDIMVETISRALVDFFRLLPVSALQTAEGLRTSPLSPDGLPELDVLEALGNPMPAIESLISPFYSERVLAHGLFAFLRMRLDENVRNTAVLDGLPPQGADNAVSTVRAYMKDTPFETLFFAKIPVPSPT